MSAINSDSEVSRPFALVSIDSSAAVSHNFEAHVPDVRNVDTPAAIWTVPQNESDCTLFTPIENIFAAPLSHTRVTVAIAIHSEFVPVLHYDARAKRGIVTLYIVSHIDVRHPTGLAVDAEASVQLAAAVVA
jgi:hypothetical protein